MKNKDDLSAIHLDNMYSKTDRLTVPVTPAFKKVFANIADNNRITLAELVRQAMFYYANVEYPDFDDQYTHIMRENSNGR